MTELLKLLTDGLSSEDKTEEKINEHLKTGNIFKDIYALYQNKDTQNLDKIKSIFFDTDKFSEEFKIKLLTDFFDFIKISIKFKRTPENDTNPIYMTRTECTHFTCYCFTDLFYGTSYLKLILKKELYNTKTSINVTYAERMVKYKLIPFMIFLPGDKWDNPNWEQDMNKVNDVIFLLLNDNKTHPLICNYLEKDIIGSSDIERKMLNQMSVVIDMTKLTLYFNTINLLLKLWRLYIGNMNDVDFDVKIRDIGIRYPRTSGCKLAYYELEKYEQNSNEDLKEINFNEKCYFMLHRLVENIFLTTQNKYSVIETELENLRKYQQKLEKEQAANFEPQKELQKSIVVQRIAKLTPHYYTFLDYLNANNVKNVLSLFYEKSSIWICQHIHDVYHYEPDYIPIMENMIDNFSDFMSQHIKYINIPLNNTISTFKLIISDNKYVTNPFIKIRSVDNLFDFIINNEAGINYIFDETFRQNLIMSLMSYYTELEFNNESLYYYKFGTRFHILHLIHFLKDMDAEYTLDLISVKYLNSDLYDKFIYILLSDFNYLLNEGLTNITEIKKIEAIMEKAEKEKESQIEQAQPVVINQNPIPFDALLNNINQANDGPVNDLENIVNMLLTQLQPEADNVLPNQLQPEVESNLIDDGDSPISYQHPLPEVNVEHIEEEPMDIEENDIEQEEHIYNDEENELLDEDIMDDEDMIEGDILDDEDDEILGEDIITNTGEDNLVENIRRVNRLTSIVNNDFNYIDELFQLFFLLLEQNKEAFLTEDICNHLIEILNYYLVKLAKRTSDNLEEDIDKYNYNPYKILQSIARLYMGLSTEEVFLKLMVSNIESFSVENINIMIEKLMSIDMIDEYTVNGLYMMLQNISQIRDTQELNVLDKLDEMDVLPSEYYDPIFSIPIKNPIALPTSQYILEKKTIFRHLISNEFDPTNRKPLTKEEVEKHNNNSDTQEKIQKFIQNRDEWVTEYLKNNQNK